MVRPERVRVIGSGAGGAEIPAAGNRWSGHLVVALATSSRLGGAERSMLELVAGDRASGGCSTIIARDDGDGPLSRLACELGVPMVRAKSLPAMVRQLRRLGADAVYCFGFRWSMCLRFAVRVLTLASLRRPPIVLVAQRGLDTWRRPVHNFVDRATQSLVDVYVANSRAAMAMLVERVGVDLTRIEVLRVGPSESWAYGVPDRSSGRTPARIMVVGSARPEKAHDDVLRALTALAGDDGWVATVYTTGDVRGPRSAELAIPTAVVDRITVVRDHRLTVADYDRHDILFHPSRSESLPRAVLEAQARGLAVVATCVGDVADLALERDCIVEPGDVESAAKGLLLAIERVISGADGDADGELGPATEPLRLPSPLEAARELRGLLGRVSRSGSLRTMSTTAVALGPDSTPPSW